MDNIYNKLVSMIIKFHFKHKQPMGKVKLHFNGAGLIKKEALCHYFTKLLSVALPLFCFVCFVLSLFKEGIDMLTQ